ncbi:MAG: hypothetical protein ABH805_00250 [Candidatus Nealsonbacteria bacterium]
MNTILTFNMSVAKPFALKWQFSLKKAWISMLLLTVFLLSLYVLQVNEITQSSFAVSNYDKQLSQLNQESKMLEIDFSGKSSLQSVEGLISALDYEKVERVHYIQVLTGTALAK